MNGESGRKEDFAGGRRITHIVIAGVAQVHFVREAR